MSQNTTTAPPVADQPNRLRPGAIGLAGVLLLAFSSAAPLIGCLGNIPLAVAFGNGVGAPSGFIIAAAVLLCFAVGYVAMTRRLTSAGGFYSFISHGVGKPFGLAAGLSAILGYLLVEVAILGGVGYFGATTFESTFGVRVPWLVTAAVVLVLASVAAYFDIQLSTRVLGILFLLEIVILTIVNAAIFIKGGAEGISLEPINPTNAFGGPAAGIGIFFAFWSWLGFEVVPNYAEESRDPKRIVPIATYLAVIGIGLILFITGWATVTGFGVDNIAKASTTHLGNSYGVLATQFVGGWATTAINWLILTGCFACILAYHQTVSRYIYAIAREGVLFPKSLAITHPTHGSPQRAVIATSAGATVLLSGFTIFYFSAPSAQEFAGHDFNTAAYAEVFGWFAIACTFWVTINQILCSIATIRYHLVPENRGYFHWWRTLVAPLIGAIGLSAALYLLWSNLPSLGGDIVWVRLIPWVCLGWFALALLAAVWLRRSRPAAYEGLGRVLAETEETAAPEIV